MPENPSGPGRQSDEPGEPQHYPLTIIVGALAALVLFTGALFSGLSGVLLFAGIFALCTMAYTLVTGRKSWALLPSRRIAAFGVAGALVMTFAGSAMAGPHTFDDDPPTAIAPSTSAVALPSSAPTALPTFTSDSPTDPPTVATTALTASVAIPTAAVTTGTAETVLAALPVKGSAPATGYQRTTDFGAAWVDIAHTGCDTRNEILARDLTDVKKSGYCRVVSGTLTSPYTGAPVHFVRGDKTSPLVQIDHLVSLKNAWATGAQKLTQAQRESLANDPVNLMAVDGWSNDQKGSKDASGWLPANKSFRCAYVSHQISVKATYGLWVTASERSAMLRVLKTCPEQRAFSSPFAPPSKGDPSVSTEAPKPGDQDAATPTAKPTAPTGKKDERPGHGHGTRPPHSTKWGSSGGPSDSASNTDVPRQSGRPSSTPTTSPAPASTAAPSPAPTSSAPAGATAICTDGSYSFVTKHRGACSRHGGVSEWLGK